LGQNPPAVPDRLSPAARTTQALRLRGPEGSGTSVSHAVTFAWGDLFASPSGESVLITDERDRRPILDPEGALALLFL
jgi:hypothetical protein